MEILQLKREDALEIAAVHTVSFPGFFLTDLGKDFLHVFYEVLIQEESTIVWGVKMDNELVGFFVSSTEPTGLYHRIFKKHYLKFFMPLTFSFLTNINLFGRMITSIVSTKSFEVAHAYSASLLSICVSPAYAGKGIGKILLSTLEKELLLRKRYGYYLTTDANNNNATNQFYLNFGFKLYGTYSQGKRKMNTYLKDIK